MVREVVAVALLSATLGCGRGSQASVSTAAISPEAAEPLRWDLAYDRVIGGQHDLCVAPAGGGPERRLTREPAEDRLPRYARDGSAILFSSDRSGSYQLWEVPTGGGAARRIRANDSVDWQADPAPDGRRIALLSKVEGPEVLFVLDRVSGRARTLVRHGRNTKGGRSILGNPHWSNDGARIVFSSNVSLGHQIYVVDVETGRESQVSPSLSGGCEPRFSPDGRKVVYVSRRLW